MTAVFLIIVFLFFSWIGLLLGGLFDGDPMGNHAMLWGLSVVVIGSLTVIFDKLNKIQESLRQIKEKQEQDFTPTPASAEDARAPKTATPSPDAAVNAQPPDNSPSKPLSGDGSADTSE